MPTALRSTIRCVAATLALAATIMAAGQAQQAPRPAPDAYSAMRWRYIGPEGNRFSAAAGIAGDASTYFVGAASGGRLGGPG